MNYLQPSRSKLKLTSVKYLKIISEGETYFFLEKIYVSKCDANIKLTRISEEIYKDAFYNDALLETIKLEVAKPHIKNTIKRLREEM